MTVRVKKIIVLPADLARDAEAAALAQCKTLSAVIEEALRRMRSKRIRQKLRDMQNYWNGKARDQGICIEADLDRCLRS